MEYIVLAVQLMVLVATIYVFYLSKKGAPSRPEIYPNFQESRVADNLVVEKINELIIELKRTSSKINKDMAKQSSVLQSLIAEADRRIDDMKVEVAPKPKRTKTTTPVPKSTEASVNVIRTNEATTAYNSILRLASEGMDSVEIARQANLGRGEVELLLDLRKSKRKEEQPPEEEPVDSTEAISLMTLDELARPRPRGESRMFGTPSRKTGYVREVEK